MTDLRFRCGCFFAVSDLDPSEPYFRISVDVCLPAGPQTRQQYCAQEVCPAVQRILVQGAHRHPLSPPPPVPERRMKCTDVPLISADVTRATIDDTCPQTCGVDDIEFCSLDIAKLLTEEPTIEGNQDTCNSLAMADAVARECGCTDALGDSPYFECTAGAVVAGPFCAPNTGLDPEPRRLPNALTVAERPGIVGQLYTPRSRVELDPAKSSVTVSVDGEAVEVPLSGTVDIWGSPCPGAECAIGVGVSARPENFELAGHTIVDSDIVLRTDAQRVELNALGVGVLPAGGATAVLRGTFDGEVSGFRGETRAPFTVRVDWDAGTFGMGDGFVIPSEGGSPEIAVRTLFRGTIVSQPPRLAAPTDISVECNSPRGTVVQLDASETTDPDGDLAWVQWYDGQLIEPERALAGGATASPVAPLGTHSFGLVAGDRLFQTASALTTVEVVDRTAPELRSVGTEAPPCLWPPNHEYAVLRLDRELRGEIVDACDPSPSLTIQRGRSDQSDDAHGDGQTTQDLVVFPEHICVRAERSGGDRDGRVYQVDMTAEDAFGNSATRTLEILVPHDQSVRCREIPVVERVSNDSPLCDPARAAAAWARLTPESSSGSSNDHPAACSVAISYDAAPQRLFYVALVLVCVCTRRRRVSR